MSSPSPSSPGKLVDVSWLIAHVSDPATVVIDVRPPAQYIAGHIPGAISLDVASLRLPASDERTVAVWTSHLQKGLRTAGIDAASHVVFYEDVSGTLVAFGVWLLDVAGFGNGSFLDGGLRAWQAAGQTLSTAPVTPAPSTIELSIDTTALATADEILGDLDHDAPANQLVDTRGDAEYRAGTIPGSIHVEWANHLDPSTGKLKSPEKLKALYAGAGITPERTVVTYCAAGFRAAHTYVILKSLGFPDVRTYAPSWSEWSQRPDTPVEPGKPQPTGN